MERKIRNVAKIGVFAVAHDTYLGQFEGLWEKLNSYYYDFLHNINDPDIETVDFGIVTSSEQAYETAEKIQGAGVDLLFCDMITYATSSVFAPIMRNVDVPVVLVALQPRYALDYTCLDAAKKTANCSVEINYLQCGAPILHHIRGLHKFWDGLRGLGRFPQQAERGTAQVSRFLTLASQRHCLLQYV